MHVVGCGGQGILALEIAEELGIEVHLYDALGRAMVGKIVGGHTVVGSIDDLIEGPVIVAIGDNDLKKRLVSQLLNKHFGFGKLISPRAFVSPHATVGEGVIIGPYSCVHAGAVVGRHVKIDSNCIVAHDCELCDFVSLSAGCTLAGRVYVGEGTQVGVGAAMIPKVSIGQWCKIGAGAVVIRNVPAKHTVVGNPARQLPL